jgi:hypothetical protein
MTQEELIAEIRKFLSGLLGEGTGAVDTASSAAVRGDSASAEAYARETGARDLPAYINPIKPARPDPKDIYFLPNARARLQAGLLLLGVQKDNSVHLYDPETGGTELVCRFLNTPMLLWRAVPAPDGTFYCSLSGTRWPDNPDEVAFGQGGTILHIDSNNETMEVVPGSEQFADPGELRLLDNGELLVVDFEGFGGTGSVHSLNPQTGTKTTLMSGGLLREPVAAVFHPDGTLFIANSVMSYSHPAGPGGERVKETGAILRLDPDATEVTVLRDESRTPSGVIDSLALEQEQHRYLIFTRNDWPRQETGGIFQLDLETNKVTPIIEATREATLFVRNETGAHPRLVHAADSYNKVMLTIDAIDAKIIDRKPLNDILGPGIGMVTPLETVESLRPIPEQVTRRLRPRG